MSFFIRLRTSEFLRRRSGSVVGPVWLEMDGQEFPIDVWYDFPVVIAGWWLSNVKSLIANEAVKCACPFMDGPYKFDVTVQSRSSWTVTFIKDEVGREKRLLERQVEPKVIVSEMLASANTVVKLCQEKQWESEDLVILEREIGEVKGLM